MTHYSENPGMVRADFFKPSGKWYMTTAIDMSKYYNSRTVYAAVRDALDASLPGAQPLWWSSYTVVVAEPYHSNAYPVMLVSELDMR